MGDVEIRKQREDKNGCRENGEQKEEGQRGGAVEYVVVHDSAPQLPGEIDEARWGWRARGRRTPSAGYVHSAACSSMLSPKRSELHRTVCRNGQVRSCSAPQERRA